MAKDGRGHGERGGRGNASSRGGGRGGRGGQRGQGRGGGGGGGKRLDAWGAKSGSTGPSSSPAAAVPANWPPEVRYLTRPVYAGISAHQRQLLQTQPGDGTGRPLPEIPPILRFGPSPLVAIRLITDPAHPACGQRGLFAARNLAPGSFIVPYLGVYHRGNVPAGGGGGGSGGGHGGTNRANRRESDYDLWLDRAADVAVDAERQGNEARFVNDYRGTGRPRPNAEFREVWDPRRGERAMAVYVLPAASKPRLVRRPATAAGGSSSSISISSSSTAGIAQGEEIFVSYGKGFWEMRQKESASTGANAAAETQTGNAGDKPEPETLPSRPEAPASVQSVAAQLGALSVGTDR